MFHLAQDVRRFGSLQKVFLPFPLKAAINYSQVIGKKISICQSLLNVLRLRSTGKRLDRCNTDEKSQKITLAMKDSHSIIRQDKTDKEAYYERVEDRLIRNVKTGLKTCSSTADCGPKEMRWTALLETCQRQKQLPPQRHNFT